MNQNYSSSEVRRPSNGQLPTQAQQQQQQQRQLPRYPAVQGIHAQQHTQNYRPRSLVGALSLSLYESLSFSRSPSFERTRYIASTCTFIAIIYLRTLHCLFFGTGALSCAVLAKCLKHIIRQPRPEKIEPLSTEEIDPAPSGSTSTSSIIATDSTNLSNPHSIPSKAEGTSTINPTDSGYSYSPIPRTGSPTLALAPTTTLQQEQVNLANETKEALTVQRIPRQRRRRVYLRVDYGMPSSHAQLVAFFVCYISLQLILMEPEGSPGQWFLIMLLQLYAWSVVWSRIQLGRHSISQVLVGAAIGAVYGMAWFAIWVWKVEEMIQHWQWMDRYGVIQVRKMWKQLELEETVAIGGVGGQMYLQENYDARLFRI